MENLPLHLAEEILFRLDRKSLARSKCVNRELRSKISEPEFCIEYFCRSAPACLIHSSGFGSNYVRYVSDNTKTEPEASGLPMRCQILGSGSGLVLLFLHQLCVLNPITRKFRLLGEESSRFTQNILSIRGKRQMKIGFSVDNIDQTSQRFGVVSINEEEFMLHPDVSIYRFEIYDGDNDSWRVSETTIACPASNLVERVKPVYFNRALHWLRRDGSIVAFNPEKDEARIIPTTFPSLESTHLWLGAVEGNKTLTLISATETLISVFILRDDPIPTWVLRKQINNDAIETGKWLFWTIVTYNERFLVVQETKEKGMSRLLHRYDAVAEEWSVLGDVPTWMDTDQDFFHFKASWLDGAVRRSRPLRSLRQFMQMIGTHYEQI
ncbi:PREDICTED: putative F-box/kelch-repeat protein At1g20790 [Tarenaya hassleriana]|uniref:putative F-box/kelch-repeat protein At1g20790 n=1 Tax=Tarenaya hassleriana TaxID=28532 RepID=UPI00053C9A1E|nr:PREDICTED: putative F-box/kelch-repeat protein At1g20790 [Tarenaya hassleriana]